MIQGIKFACTSFQRDDFVYHWNLQANEHKYQLQETIHPSKCRNNFGDVFQLVSNIITIVFNGSCFIVPGKVAVEI